MLAFLIVVTIGILVFIFFFDLNSLQPRMH